MLLQVEGVLQNELNLTRTDSPDPDVLILNTCSIRDHAEQKVYDALGSYAAAKRNGKQIAMIVTGCVAQQEGEKLLRRVPEIDAVLGTFRTMRMLNVVASLPMKVRNISLMSALSWNRFELAGNWSLQLQCCSMTMIGVLSLFAATTCGDLSMSFTAAMSIVHTALCRQRVAWK